MSLQELAEVGNAFLWRKYRIEERLDQLVRIAPALPETGSCSRPANFCRRRSSGIDGARLAARIPRQAGPVPGRSVM